MHTNTVGVAPQEPVPMTFEFTDDALRRLEAMRQRSGADSYAEVLRNALRLYQWVRDREREGFHIGLARDDKLVRTITFQY
ncbi:MAG: hypothetical protein KGI78_01095 [Patescibacteria group bacterium]|nr:hypothetical protein [Patescibacteria group bacterium]MDE2057432.1 hypothetical protein [Patescibacteria group bacterium]